MGRNDDISDIAALMVVDGLPLSFVERVSEIAEESPGVADMLRIWHSASSPGLRDESVVAMQEALDDRDPFEVGRDRRIFEEAYALKHGLSRKQLRERGARGERCEDSGEKEMGWAIVPEGWVMVQE